MTRWLSSRAASEQLCAGNKLASALASQRARAHRAASRTNKRRHQTQPEQCTGERLALQRRLRSSRPANGELRAPAGSARIAASRLIVFSSSGRSIGAPMWTSEPTNASADVDVNADAHRRRRKRKQTRPTYRRRTNTVRPTRTQRRGRRQQRAPRTPLERPIVA